MEPIWGIIFGTRFAVHPPRPPHPSLQHLRPVKIHVGQIKIIESFGGAHLGVGSSRLAVAVDGELLGMIYKDIKIRKIN